MIEAIAAIFSLWCVWLAVKNNKWTWPIGIIGVGAYIIVFWLAKLYADFGLQIIFMAQGFYGWWYWIGGRKKIEPPISKMSKWDIFIITPIALGASTWALGILLHKYTDAALPYYDALASTTSLVANWLLAKRKLENWYLWIPVNLLYIGIFIYKEMPISAVLYVIFFVLAIKGLNDWRKEYVIR